MYDLGTDNQLHFVDSPVLSDAPPPFHDPMAPALSRQSSVPAVTVSQDVDILQPETEETKRVLKREDERQKLFDKVSNTILDIPNGYCKVEVLIIRWDESIDEFKDHDKEVSKWGTELRFAYLETDPLQIARLHRIFVEKFHYGCHVEKLHNTDDPQLDLDHIIMSHVRAHNGENNLLIVYYTGHANQIEGRLRLSA
jgi:hypothetical protein